MFGYEQMALSFDMLAKACLKQSPLPVINVTKGKPSERVHRKGVCPLCFEKNGAAMILEAQYPYCPFCGQKLDWTKLNEYEDSLKGKGEK